MTKTFLIVALIVAFFSACCKRDTIAGIRIEYASLTGDHELEVIQQSKTDTTEFVPLFTRVLNEANSHQMFIEMRYAKDFNYILQIDSFVNGDIISNFTYEIEGKNCNAHVASVSYNLNGEAREDMRLLIP